MSSNATKIAAAVDLNDWSIRNWPSVVWYWVKYILYCIFTIAAIGLLLSGIIFVVVLAMTRLASFAAEMRKKRQPSKIEDGIAMQDNPQVGDDEATQRLLANEGDETKTGEKGSDEDETLPEYEGKPFDKKPPAPESDG